MLSGPTVFVGDSITVGVTSFVQNDGPKTMVAVGGLGSVDILGIVRAAESRGKLDNQTSMVVLGGTNDIGNSSRSIASVFSALSAIWALGHAHRMRVIALTVPPAKGFQGFASNFDAINGRRKTLNQMIQAAKGTPNGPDEVIDLDALIGDASDRDKLAPAFDSSDHLHPNMPPFGKALTAALVPPSATPSPSPSANLSSNFAGAKATLKLGAEAAAVGGLVWGGYRLLKRWL